MQLIESQFLTFQNPDGSKIYFTEALYTLCNFAFPKPHFCYVNWVSGIGDNWRKIIFLIMTGKNDQNPTTRQNCALSLYFIRRTDGLQAPSIRSILRSRTNRIIFSSSIHTLPLFFSLLFDYMKRIADNVITGIDRKLNLYYYYSNYSGRNIVRRCTSLTGERVKKDAAFKGFRESGNRMKEASPIAASLYKMVPEEIKQYSLYRLLTGEALKMLKAGNDSATITEKLKQLYIDPLLDEPVREHMNIERTRPGNRGNSPGLKNIIRYFPIESKGRRRLRRKSGSLQHSTSNLLEKEAMPIPEQTIRSSNSISDNVLRGSRQQTPTPKTKYPELIYRCRLRECKKLKLWIRSSSFPGGQN